MKTITINLYDFDELSKEAKTKALQEHCSQSDFFWYDEYFESLKAGIEHFDFELNDYSIDYTGYSPSYIKITAKDDCDLTGEALKTYLLANYNEAFNQITKKYQPTFTEDLDCMFTGYCADISFMEPINEFIKKPYDITIEELIQKGFDNWLKDIKSEYEYTQTEDYFKDHCEANEYTFEANGVMRNETK